MNTMVEQLDHLIKLLKREAEEHRREPKSMDATPLTGDILDYGTACTAIGLAMHHLDESLPSGQRVRSEKALALLAVGMFALEEWMREKGYTTPGSEGEVEREEFSAHMRALQMDVARDRWAAR